MPTDSTSSGQLFQESDVANQHTVAISQDFHLSSNTLKKSNPPLDWPIRASARTSRCTTPAYSLMALRAGLHRPLAIVISRLSSDCFA